VLDRSPRQESRLPLLAPAETHPRPALLPPRWAGPFDSADEPGASVRVAGAVARPPYLAPRHCLWRHAAAEPALLRRRLAAVRLPLRAGRGPLRDGSLCDGGRDPGSDRARLAG